MDNKEMMESEYTYKDKPINTRIKKEQDRIEEEVVKIALGKEPGFKAIDSFYLNYGTDAEYLVEGAVLTCDRATTEVKVIGGQVFQNTVAESVTEKKRTVLKVSPNATLCNGLMMATIKDREIGTNIEAFHCNCEYGPSNDEELHAILEDVENCKQYGTCQKLMKLNDDWENIIKINAGGMDTGYQSYSHTSADGITEQADGITMASMLFCSHGGLITPIDSGQKVRLYYTDEDIRSDIANKLYSEEDFYYLVDVLAGEANTYEGMVAVAYEVLNRCQASGKSIKDVLLAGGYTGFDVDRVGIIPEDSVARGAALAVLRKEVDNPIGDIQHHFGKVSNYDLWYERNKCTSVIVIGEGAYKNVFYEPYGSVHNMMSEKTPDAVIIYDSSKNKWLLDGDILKNEEE